MAGEYPGERFEFEARTRLNNLLDAGLTFFLDLTEQTSRLTPYETWLKEEGLKRNLEVGYRRMEIIDADIPTDDLMQDILAQIRLSLAEGHCVYVHCWGGIGRTGTVVGCYLAEQVGSGEEALRQMNLMWEAMQKKWRCPSTPQTQSQTEMVKRWRR